MRKSIVTLALIGLAAAAALGLVSCGAGSEGDGKDGGTLRITYAEPPDYMDPQLSYTAEGWTAMGEVPAQSPTSVEMSKALKARGFKFVGPVIVYAWMQAVGIVNDHAADCFRRRA